ncbi:hypothetical protein LP420_22705 [Massilia sp. B-10]|nr:hypothetical protein LP420_22705 [Massilia sp. B-10]
MNLIPTRLLLAMLACVFVLAKLRHRQGARFDHLRFRPGHVARRTGRGSLQRWS